MRVPVRNMVGETVDEIDLRDDVFGIEPNAAVMHQALVRQMANARLGTHKTKTRSEVRGGGAKPWRQKGTGRARQGSIRAPQWKGGGTVFGPQPASRARASRKARSQGPKGASPPAMAGIIAARPVRPQSQARLVAPNSLPQVICHGPRADRRWKSQVR